MDAGHVDDVEPDSTARYKKNSQQILTWDKITKCLAELHLYPFPEYTEHWVYG